MALVAPPVTALSCRVMVWPARPRHHADMNIEIVLTPTTGPIDEPLHGFVCGLPPGESVTVRAQLRDSRDLVLDRTFALGGTSPGQAAGNRAAWSETVPFLRERLGRPLPFAAVTTVESSPCR
jgi:hypothetical protein